VIVRVIARVIVDLAVTVTPPVEVIAPGRNGW
jgi:hypothetical protein